MDNTIVGFFFFVLLGISYLLYDTSKIRNELKIIKKKLDEEK